MLITVFNDLCQLSILAAFFFLKKRIRNPFSDLLPLDSAIAHPKNNLRANKPCREDVPWVDLYIPFFFKKKPPLFFEGANLQWFHAQEVKKSWKPGSLVFSSSILFLLMNQTFDEQGVKEHISHPVYLAPAMPRPLRGPWIFPSGASIFPVDEIWSPEPRYGFNSSHTPEEPTMQLTCARKGES